MPHETWFTYKILSLVAGTENEPPRYLTPHSDPAELEQPFDLVWDTPEQARDLMRVWLASHYNELTNYGSADLTPPSDEVLAELEEADTENAVQWYESLSPEAKAIIDTELGYLTLVKATIEPYTI